MIPIEKFKVSDRVRMNNPSIMGDGELGTVTKIDLDIHLNCPVMWVRWDIHGKEIGEICQDGFIHGWEPCPDAGLNKWLEG